MFKIGITSKLQTKLNIKVEKLNLDFSDPLFSWHAHCFPDSRRTGVIFMNDLTRYCVILFGLRKADLMHLNELFLNQLKKNMIINGYSDTLIDKYINNLSDFTYTKTSSRSILGSINDCLIILPYWRDNTLLDSDSINFINDKFNNMPMLPLKKIGLDVFPSKAMIQSLTAQFKDSSPNVPLK